MGKFDDCPEDLKCKILLEKCKDEILKWWKWRFSFVAFIFTLILAVGGFFGLKNLIGETVRGCVEGKLEKIDEILAKTVRACILSEDRTVKAGEAAEKATEAAKKADKEAKSYAEKICSLEKDVASMNEMAERVTSQFFEMQQKLEGENRNIRSVFDKDVKDLKERLACLEELVTKIAQEPQAKTEALESYRRKEAARERETEELMRRFKENEKYYISVYFNDKTKYLCEKALKKLGEVGFKPSGVNVIQAEEMLKTGQKKTASAERKFISAFKALKVNVITYTPDARKKATEVRDLIAALLELDRLEVLPRQPFMERFEDSFFTQVYPRSFLKDNFIEIYLVQE